MSFFLVQENIKQSKISFQLGQGKARKTMGKSYRLRNLIKTKKKEKLQKK